MPLGAKPTCEICSSTESSIWRKGENNTTLCNSCFMKDQNSNGKESDDNGKNATEEGSYGDRKRRAAGSTFVGTIRKSARLKPSKYRSQERTKSFSTKGKGRRVIFKKNDIYYQVGDVVSVMDHDGQIYYAQLRGFLQDQYMQKSAVITWLLPSTASPPDRFDPSTYILGPEEELPRVMDCFEFVCHCPSDYFKCQNAPYPTRSLKPELGFFWTSIGPQVKPVPTYDELYGMQKPKCHSPVKDKKERLTEKERKLQERERKEQEKRELAKEKTDARRERADARRERLKSEKL